MDDQGGFHRAETEAARLDRADFRHPAPQGIHVDREDIGPRTVLPDDGPHGFRDVERAPGGHRLAAVADRKGQPLTTLTAPPAPGGSPPAGPPSPGAASASAASPAASGGAPRPRTPRREALPRPPPRPG